MSDLKPCPFCGGEAEFYRTPIKTNVGWCDSVVVRCKSCEARTNRVLYDANKHPNDEEYDEAAAAWNQRKPMEKILERLEEEAKKAMSNSEKAAELGQKYEKHMIFNGAKGNAFEEAIEIVKEEGRLND